MSPEAKELQKREDIRDIGKQMYEEILAKDCNLLVRYYLMILNVKQCIAL